jgi:hypothetical protein
MLKGTGTRASKSRLTTFADAREPSHTTFRSYRKDDKKNPLALVPGNKSREEGKDKRATVAFLTSFLEDSEV